MQYGRLLAPPTLAMALALIACGQAAGSTTVAPATTTAPPLTLPSEPQATAPQPTETLQAGDCSAAGLSAIPVTQDLPPEVAAVRDAVVRAAVSCDYEGLAALTAPLFTYSFGASDDPAGHWRDQESRGGDHLPLEMLVEILGLPVIRYGNDGTDYYTWPSATPYPSWDEVPQPDKEALLAVYDQSELDSFEQYGSYIGYRAVITGEGDWIVFVAGD